MIIVRAILAHILFPFFLLVHLLICSPVIWSFAKLADQLEATDHWKIIGWLIRILLLFLILVVLFFTWKANDLFTFKDRSLRDTYKTAFADTRFALAFVPLIGDWFQPKSDPRDALTDEDDRAE
jgi:hypothetical protein